MAKGEVLFVPATQNVKFAGGSESAFATGLRFYFCRFEFKLPVRVEKN